MRETKAKTGGDRDGGQAGEGSEAAAAPASAPEELPGNVVPLFGGARGSVQRAAALFNRALVLHDEEASWEHAARLYREVVRLLPRHWEAWNNLGVMLYQLGEPGAALEAWGEALQVEPDGAQTHNNIGSLFQSEGKYSVAAPYLERAADLDSDMVEARVNLALCLQSLGRFTEARRHWKLYLHRFPGGEFAELAKKHIDIGRQAQREAMRSGEPALGIETVFISAPEPW